MANLFQFGRTILEEQEEYSERTEKFLELPLWRYDHHGFLAAWLVAGNVVRPLLGGCVNSTDSLREF